jgi:hypothetical protein
LLLVIFECVLWGHGNTFFQADSLAMGIKDKSKSANKKIPDQDEERCQIILKNIKDINQHAFEFARNVMQQSALHSVFADHVPALIDSLLSLAKRLEKNNPGLSKENLDRISEALLDLEFTQADSPNISRRLGLLLENMK